MGTFVLLTRLLLFQALIVPAVSCSGERDTMEKTLLGCPRSEVTHVTSNHFPPERTSHVALLEARSLGSAIQLWPQEEDVGECQSLHHSHCYISQVTKAL